MDGRERKVNSVGAASGEFEILDGAVTSPASIRRCARTFPARPAGATVLKPIAGPATTWA
jgi:hypothetical protein